MSTATHKQTGNKGEALATEYLKKKGYRILATNWRSKHLELDIIAQDVDRLVFVEVKTRSVDYYGLPEEAVSKQKEQHLGDAAEAYIFETGWEGEVRFDIIAVLVGKEPWHIEDAFFPGW